MACGAISSRPRAGCRARPPVGPIFRKTLRLLRTGAISSLGLSVVNRLRRHFHPPRRLLEPVATVFAPKNPLISLRDAGRSAPPKIHTRQKSFCLGASRWDSAGSRGRYKTWVLHCSFLEHKENMRLASCQDIVEGARARGRRRHTRSGGRAKTSGANVAQVLNVRNIYAFQLELWSRIGEFACTPM